METAVKYIDMGFSEACEAKWAAGQKIYGREFVGHPLEQLAEEIIDAHNYCDEANRPRWGYQTWPIRALLKCCWWLLQRSAKLAP